MKGKYYSSAIKILVFIIDFWLINLSFLSVKRLGFANDIPSDQFTTFFLIFGLTWIISGFFTKIYRIDTSSLVRNISIEMLGTFLVHFVLIMTMLITSNVYHISSIFLAYVYATSAVFIMGFRIFYKVVIKYYQFTGFDSRKVVILGATGSGKALSDFFISNEGAGYHFKGFFDDDADHHPDLKKHVVGKLDPIAIKEFCRKENVGEIYFALPLSHRELLKDISRFADDNFIYFRIAPDFSHEVQNKCNVFLLNSIPVLTTRKEPLGSAFNVALKRAFDIVFSLSVIMLLFPFIFPVIALAIRLDSPGPIFFKQLRPGRKNKLFDCYKFRTMKVNNSTEVQATKNDSRITRVGRFLRKSNLDELPQFFNVLLGNMSVVGPRPNMISQLEEYSKSIQNYKVRHFVTPGITGYAQVNGFRGETRELELMEKRVQYDVQYIENWSLSLDMKIIFLTVWNMVKGEKNAY
ncbi:MAG TPA: undecaprenyl-phosphate glucose phosphotransferase [Cyclobacteriaceae bacterium]|nr:undecaprenyl-phosphate glucose phosphotransferase [Cyclobacteriaceae bacterium]